ARPRAPPRRRAVEFGPARPRAPDRRVSPRAPLVAGLRDVHRAAARRAAHLGLGALFSRLEVRARGGLRAPLRVRRGERTAPRPRGLARPGPHAKARGRAPRARHLLTVVRDALPDV